VNADLVLTLAHDRDLVDDVATFLTNARHAAGLSQRGLAHAAGVGHGMIAAYESGRRHPTLTTFARLLHAAGADITITIDLTDPKPSVARLAWH
jgi:transcriptional regulator with XRE-family HTH domain